MKFTKMHGCGNDYVYVNGFTEQVKDKSAMAVRVSDRHFGIGSDGLIFINPSERADCEMEMYNSDGSRAEMCGNGIRCVAKFAYDHGIVDRTVLDVDTLAGVKRIELRMDAAGKTVIGAKVNMGAPILEPSKVPCQTALFEGYEEGPVLEKPLVINGASYPVSCISMGNPHAVVLIGQDVREFPLEQIGPLFESHPAFPKKTNTEFVRILDRSHVEMRVWERGAGETLACGTGACAVAAACILGGRTEREVTVRLLGGDLRISWSGDLGETLYMEGAAETVFTGEIME